VRIYYIGNGLSFSGNTLSVDSSITDLAKIYTIGAGLTLNVQGALSANVRDVTVDSVSVLSGGIANIVMPVRTDSTSDGAWEVIDDNGNVALRITNEGHLVTKEFNSEDFAADLHIQNIGTGLVYDVATGALSALVSTQTTSEGAYEIADQNGNVALRITNEGHLLTSQFDSEEVGRLVRIYSLGTGLTLSPSGELSATGGGVDPEI
jgi:hypothetical protein